MAVVRFVSASPEETEAIGRKLGEALTGGEVIAYRGGLGVGKTTMTRGIALGMGLPDEVSSPTFAIVNEYHKKGQLSLYHFDMYRINGLDDLESTGFYDYMTEDAVIAAEWSENIGGLPEGTVTVTLEGTGCERTVTVECSDGLAEKLRGGKKC